MIISLIAAIGKHRELGRQGQIPWHLPDDLHHFRALTLHHEIIMGRTTFLSLGSKPLPERINIILSHHPDFTAPGCLTAQSLDQALNLARGDEVFIIGGGQIFSQALPRAERLYLTQVEAEIPDADTFFPEVDFSQWQLTRSESHPQDDRHAFAFTFNDYTRL